MIEPYGEEDFLENVIPYTFDTPTDGVYVVVASQKEQKEYFLGQYRNRRMGGDESATKRIDELQKDMHSVKPLMPLKQRSHGQKMVSKDKRARNKK